MTYNAAMSLLDQIVQPAVKSRTLSAPPFSPAVGDTYIVGSGGTAAWAGQDDKFACWHGEAWTFLAPSEGWLAYAIETSELAVFSGGSWRSFVTDGGSTLAKLGIHTAADLSSRLAVAAEGSLFTHDGGGHRMVLNKASALDTASLVFKDDFSGRAELGLTGDDALHVKLSTDGSTWLEALSIAQNSGVVSLPVGQLAFPTTQNPSTNGKVLDDYEEGTWTPTIKFGGVSTGVSYSSATLGRYTKIGRLVTVCGLCSLSSKGSAVGAATLEDLPFMSEDSIYAGVAVGYASGFSGITGSVLAMVQPNTTRILLYQSNNGNATGLTNVNFTNTSAVYLTASYDAAA